MRPLWNLTGLHPAFGSLDGPSCSLSMALTKCHVDLTFHSPTPSTLKSEDFAFLKSYPYIFSLNISNHGCITDDFFEGLDTIFVLRTSANDLLTPAFLCHLPNLRHVIDGGYGWSRYANGNEAALRAAHPNVLFHFLR